MQKNAHKTSSAVEVYTREDFKFCTYADLLGWCVFAYLDGHAHPNPAELGKEIARLDMLSKDARIEYLHGLGMTK